MDKTQFADFKIPEGTARMTLNSPYDQEPIIRSDNGEEAWIELLPSDSAVGRAVDRRQLDKIFRSRNQRVKAKEAEANVIEKLAYLTKAWSLATPNGVPIEDFPVTPENAIWFYTEFTWVRNQVGLFVADLGNFRPTLSENSSISLSTNSNSAG